MTPGNALVRRAIALQFSQTQQELIQQLNPTQYSADRPTSPTPTFTINRAIVTARKKLALGNLPLYRVQGTYNLTLSLPDRTLKRQQNAFEIYLQRQREGKTWRLVRPELRATGQKPIWRSYSI